MRFSIWSLLLVLLGGCAVQPREGNLDADLWRLVDQASQGRAHFVKRFPAPEGLTGVVVQGNEPGGRQVIAWVTPEGQHLIIGNIFDRFANDLSQEAYEQYVVVPKTGDEDFIAQVSAAPAVTQFGRGERTLYIFADADCVYCHALFQDIAQLKDMFEQSSVRVRWIMVGTQSRESAQRGAAILARGMAGLEQNSMHYDNARSRGGVDPLADRRYLEQVEANTRLLMRSSAQSKATPTLIWRSSRGPQLAVGAPTQQALRAILDDILPDA